MGLRVVLPQFRAGLRQAENSQQVFHGVRFLQALPRRYLQPVVQFGAPFFFVQQSVVPQVDRVHAGHGRHQAFEMVRRMPRSGRALQRLMDTPIKQIVHRPESQAGLGCMMCHSIADVKSTMGRRIFIWSIPSCTNWPRRKNPVARALHDFLIRLNPEPHRRVFLKPFMKTQTAEFCSTCHKVHLDVPVNHYRWFAASTNTTTGRPAEFPGRARGRFTIRPSRSSAPIATCRGASKDAGNINGFVHSHRFPGANTACPRRMKMRRS
jgi:hypothetical protein